MCTTSRARIDFSQPKTNARCWPAEAISDSQQVMKNRKDEYYIEYFAKPPFRSIGINLPVSQHSCCAVSKVVSMHTSLHLFGSIFVQFAVSASLLGEVWTIFFVNLPSTILTYEARLVSECC